MSSIRLLRKLGLYIEENFFSTQFCDALRPQMDIAPPTIAGLYSTDMDAEFIDLKVRQTMYSEPAESIRAEVVEKICALKPTLEAHFGDVYHETFERPKFLIYQPDDFFAPHTDDQAGRKINMTIYLNDECETPEPGCYVGGSLKFYGLIDHPQWKNKGMSLSGQAGLFVAYRSDIVHEVTPIIAGQRYAIVSRFLAADRKYVN